MTDLFEPLSFAHGPAMKNRLMLAPLTNLQSHDDGRLSDDEFRWLTMRAQGGFGLTMTCAAYVQAQGRGFAGQLGIYSDIHIPGLSRLAEAIRKEGSLAVAQLHHAGIRAPAELIGTTPVGPSGDAETGARAMTAAEVEQLIEDFVAAAVRAQRSGFDGVEIHGAHGYVLAQFLSAEFNRRSDRFGGALENRWRVLFEIIGKVRTLCGPQFNIGVRLSPERFGQSLPEIRQLAQRLFREAQIDYLDLSLWDAFKEPAEEAYRGRSLMSCFTDLDRGPVRLAVAGKIKTARNAIACLQAGADMVAIGRSAILHHDFPKLVRDNPDFEPIRLPVAPAYLQKEGLGERFVDYMRTWPNFVSP
jgi:2,4-dienoyl-CoA reductase-like NADH-dependent reductase (Old Yellow Enzyme family)